MKKIRLDVDALEVETFAAADEGGERGTVHGHSAFPDCPSGFPDCGSKMEECYTRYGNWTCPHFGSCGPEECEATFVEVSCLQHNCDT